MKGLPDNGRRELASRDEANLILNFVIFKEILMKKDELRRGKSSGLVRQPSISRTGRVIKPTESAKAWQEQKDMPTNGNRLNRYTHIYKIYSIFPHYLPNKIVYKIY